MSFLGSSKVAKNSTTIDSSTRDNRVAAQNSDVVATGGGNYTNTAGSLNAGGNITLTDPNSFAFAGELVKSLLGANQQTIANASGATSHALDTVAQLAAGQHIGADGAWKKWAGIAAGVAAIAAAAWFLLKRRK